VNFKLQLNEKNVLVGANGGLRPMKFYLSGRFEREG